MYFKKRTIKHTLFALADDMSRYLSPKKLIFNYFYPKILKKPYRHLNKLIYRLKLAKQFIIKKTKNQP
jgi:hypothetical protein